MVNKVYLFAAILALAHFTFILAGSGMTKQPQKRLVGFVDLEEHNRILAYQYKRYHRFQLLTKIMSLLKEVQTTTEAPPTKNKPYLHEALYSFNRFG
jgi:hypothetical protein